MKSLLLLAACIVVCSCTVEKRLHSRGWNIQWKKNYPTSKSEPQKDDHKTVKATQKLEAVSSDDGLDNKRFVVQDEVVSTNAGVKPSEMISHEDVKETQIVNEIGSISIGQSEGLKENLDANNKTLLDSARGGGGVGLSILYLVLAVLCVILAILCYSAAVATAHWGWALLAVLGILSFTSFAIFFLVVGLIKLF